MKQASTNYPPRFEVLRRGTVTITSTPPKTAKSTLSGTRPANNFSNRENVALDDDWFSVSVFFENLRISSSCQSTCRGVEGRPTWRRTENEELSADSSMFLRLSQAPDPVKLPCSMGPRRPGSGPEQRSGRNRYYGFFKAGRLASRPCPPTITQNAFTAARHGDCLPAPDSIRGTGSPFGQRAGDHHPRRCLSPGCQRASLGQGRQHR